MYSKTVINNITTDNSNVFDEEYDHYTKKLVKVNLFWKSESENYYDKKKRIKKRSRKQRKVYQSEHNSDTSSGESGYDSIGNKSSPNKNPCKQSKRVTRDSLSGRIRKAKGNPGSRRNQRFMNDAYLGRRDDETYDSGPSDDEIELDPPMEWRNHFESLFIDEENFNKFRPFIDTTEEIESELFKRYHIEYSSESSSESDDDIFFGSDKLTKLNFDAIDKETKKLLYKYSDSDFLEYLHTTIYFYLNSLQQQKKETPNGPEPNEFFSFSFNNNSKYQNQGILNDYYLKLKMQDSLHRKLVHGICNYYSLQSKSINDNNQRITIVYCKNKIPFVPSISIAQYLNETKDKSIKYYNDEDNYYQYHFNNNNSNYYSQKKNKNNSRSFYTAKKNQKNTSSIFLNNKNLKQQKTTNIFII
eukprot:TRINITY_DN1705_c2_g2_i2.p1 TRINITY_DN1705_c2_g2~~TRINITY_DN1705_c2_g2_i2.p1  ORF type:complete len:445 (+),score=112.48 TRINITY_DN1705_c2_g2_i2:92-1336(+)